MGFEYEHLFVDAGRANLDSRAPLDEVELHLEMISFASDHPPLGIAAEQTGNPSIIR